jgi:hypothetical protein
MGAIKKSVILKEACCDENVSIFCCFLMGLRTCSAILLLSKDEGFLTGGLLMGTLYEGGISNYGLLHLDTC